MHVCRTVDRALETHGTLVDLSLEVVCSAIDKQCTIAGLERYLQTYACTPSDIIGADISSALFYAAKQISADFATFLLEHGTGANVRSQVESGSLREGSNVSASL